MVAYIFSERFNKKRQVSTFHFTKNNIFNWEVKSTTIGTDNEKGNGFGSIIAKELIEKLSGELYFTSEEGRGTSFFCQNTFRLQSNSKFNRIKLI